MGVDYDAMVAYGVTLSTEEWNRIRESIDNSPGYVGEEYLVCADEMNGEHPFFAVVTHEADWGSFVSLSGANELPTIDSTELLKFASAAVYHRVDVSDAQWFLIMRVS